MDAIGTLAGGIAHDLNNLLTIILGYSELIISGKEKEDSDFEDMAKIILAARTAAEVTRQILAFSRKAETKTSPINLNERVDRLRRMLSRFIPKTMEFTVNFDPDLPIVKADPAQIDQVLMNLALNARDAMPEGGRLTIETKTMVLDDEYCRCHIEASEGIHAVIAVSDTGIGIDRASMERIFEPFYTTKKPGEGTGLGLAVVYGIVKGQNGHIICDSEPGVGTTFKIYLPVCQVEAEPDVTSSRQFSARGTGTILLVDDEQPVRDLGNKILAQAGYDVISACDGLEALEIYGQRKDEIALVILDLVMPLMDGKQCLAEILEIDPEARVLISTGYSPDGATRESLGIGAKGFVEKPFDSRQFLNAVQNILNEQ